MYFRVENCRKVPFETSFLFSVKPGLYDDERNLALYFHYGKRGKQHVHYGPMDMGKKEGSKQEAQHCVIMHLGLWDGRCNGFKLETNFLPWKIMQDAAGRITLDSVRLNEGYEVLNARKKESIAERAFTSYYWPLPRRTTNDDPLEDAPQLVQDDESMNAKKKYVFLVLNNKAHVEVVSTRRRGEEDSQQSSWVELCNFEFYNYKAIYQFSDDTAPFHVMECRWKNPQQDNGKVLHLKHGQHVTGAERDYEFVIVEVNIQLDKIKVKMDLVTLFTGAFPMLSMHNMDVDVFLHLVNGMEAPDISNAITQFGRQADDFYVFKNCCILKGLIYSHAEVSVHVIPQLFHKYNFSPAQYPKMVIIPFPPVRYHIFTEGWNNIIPGFFANNEMAAKATFCMGLMAMQASNFWAGAAGMPKFPITWLYSSTPGTGKTTAATLVNAFMGKGDNLFAGSSTSVAMQTRGALTNCGMLCVDDYVQSRKNDKVWAEMMRQWYDHQGRSIGGDNARDFIADSGLMVTSNEIVCERDTAVQARLLVFEFEKLKGTSGLSELQTFQELVSALMPDFDTLLYDRKLDKEVIADCSNFLHQAVGEETMDRKIGMWAWLLYYMLLVSWMAQSVEGEPEAIIKWVVQQCKDSARQTKNSHSTVRRFVYALSKVMPDAAMAGCHVTERAETSVHWHNFRNVTKDGIDYYCIRPESVCKAIRTKLQERFPLQQLVKALGDEEGTLAVDDAQFANLTTWPYYMQTEEFGPKIALKEFEIKGDLLTAADQKAVMIPKLLFEEIVKEHEEIDAQSNIDYTEILIQSYHHPKYGSKVDRGLDNCAYCFFAMATGRECLDPVRGTPVERFILRALRQTTFAPFCGPTNICNVAVNKPHRHDPHGEQRLVSWDPHVERLNSAAGFGDVDSCMGLESIRSFFGTTMPTLSVLPPCYTYNPYAMRDDAQDEAVQDPRTYHPDCDGSSDSGAREFDDSEDDYFVGEEPFSPKSVDSQSLDGFSDGTPESPVKRQRREDDYQFEQQTPSPLNPGDPGSTPLGDISNVCSPKAHGEGLASAGDAAVFRAKSAAAAMDEDELERELETEFEIQEELEREGDFESNFEVSIHSPQKTRTSKQYT